MITIYHGSNTYIAKKRIAEKTVNLDPFNVVDLDEPTLEKLNREITTSPLFSTRRVIIVQSLKKLPANNKKIIGILQNKRETTHVFFIVDVYGKKYEQLATYLKKFQVIKTPKFNEKVAKAYLCEQARAFNIQLSDPLADYFLFAVGLQPEEIDLELGNYIKSKGPLVPTRTDLDKLLTRRTNMRAFQLTKTIYRDPYSKTLNTISLFFNENPANYLELIHLLIADLRVGIMIKSTKEYKIPQNRIPENPFRIRILRKSLGKYSLNQIIDFYCALNEAIYEGVRMGRDCLPMFYYALYTFKEG